jgi:hypothetical protein
MKEVFVFIYSKDGKIKALSIEESKKLHDELVIDNWKHTLTLNAALYIEYLHNDCKEVDLVNMVKSLSYI